MRHPSVAFLTQKVGLECWRDTLTDVTGLSSAFEEGVNCINLIAGKRLLPRNTIFRTWHEIDLVPYTTVSRQDCWNLIRENISKLSCQFDNRIIRGRELIP